MQRIGLQWRFSAPSTVGEFEKERTSLGPRSDVFLLEKLGCGVCACENRQLRVSHAFSVRVGSSVADLQAHSASRS